MPRFVYYTASSLDGFVADADGSLDWLFASEGDPEGPGAFDTFDATVGALVMGRTTYDWLSTVLRADNQPWPHRQPAWVMTRQAPPAEGPANVTFTGEPVEAVAAAMRGAAGDLSCWVVGGGRVATAFADAGLIDEVIVTVAPILLGSGTPILNTRLPLRLEAADRSRDFAVLRYAVVRD